MRRVFSWIWLLALVGIGLVGCSPAAKPKPHAKEDAPNDGRVLSLEESEAAVADFAGLIRAMKTDDISTYELDYEPKTKQGHWMKYVFQQKQATENRYQKVLEREDDGDVITFRKMETAEGRKQILRQIAALVKARNVFDLTSEYDAKAVFKVFGFVAGKDYHQVLDETLSDMKRVRSACLRECAAMEKLVRFADAKKVAVKGKSFVYRNRAEEDAGDQLIMDWAEATKAFQSEIERSRVRREERVTNFLIRKKTP